LNGFTDTVPERVDAKADVEKGAGEPGEPEEREQLQIVD
jgi:hypothetical protein